MNVVSALELVLGINEKIHEQEKKVKTTATAQCQSNVVCCHT